MSEIRFTKDHEWVRLDGGTATIGITDHAQQTLGDLVFIELPDEGRAVAAGEACAIVESVKAASDVYAPLAGTVVARNDAVLVQPALVNRAPQDAGWFFKLELADPAAFATLMEEAEYQRLVESLA